MRFTIDTQELNSGINTVIKAIGNRTTISILEGIYLEATFNGLLLRCTDLSLQIETILPAHVSQEGACVMPGRLFSELARRLPGEETEIYTEENTVYISSGRARTNMQSENPGEFHCMPPVKEEYAVSISQGTFKSMIRQCIFASAQDESKPSSPAYCWKCGRKACAWWPWTATGWPCGRNPCSPAGMIRTR